MNIRASVISAAIEEAFRVIKVRCLGRDDIRTADEAAPFGIDSSPVKDMIAIYAPTVDKSEPVIVGYLNAEQLAQPGEVRIYSTNESGAMKTYAWLKADGTMEIGGDADHMVRYSELETAFNQLKSDFNDLVTKFNSHVHSGVTTGGGSSGPTATPGTSSSADISPAKITEIKTL